MPETEIFDRILKQNLEREDILLGRFARKSSQASRRDPSMEKVPDAENVRSPFFHDTDKIIHSLAYTRYIDKTQVFYLFDNDHITHRVLHVQFVAKIARAMARCLRLNEDLVEAIALGHDIGHPPFGHDGEEILSKIAERNGIGAFRHNAQSVRWMLELENWGRGLNLCLETLDGMLAHDGEHWRRSLEPQRGKTWEDFLGEYQGCLRDSDAGRQLRPTTLEGAVTRVADVIAYVGRDLEDAITLKVLRREELPPGVVAVLGSDNSSIINTLVLDAIENSAERDAIAFSEPVFHALDQLLAFNYERIYRNPRVHEDPAKLQRLFQVVYEKNLEDLMAKRAKSSIMRFYQMRMRPEHLEHTPPARVVIDFLSGMTDDFFLRQAREILLPEGFGLRAPP